LWERPSDEGSGSEEGSGFEEGSGLEEGSGSADAGSGSEEGSGSDLGSGSADGVFFLSVEIARVRVRYQPHFSYTIILLLL